MSFGLGNLAATFQIWLDDCLMSFNYLIISLLQYENSREFTSFNSCPVSWTPTNQPAAIKEVSEVVNRDGDADCFMTSMLYLFRL